MRVFVKNLDDKVFSLEIEWSDSIASIKAKVQEKTGLEFYLQKLIHAGHQLDADGEKKVSDYGIQDGATILIVYRSAPLNPFK